MKKIVLTLLTTLAVITACSRSTAKEDKNNKSAKIKFEETEHDYGTIKQNSNGTCEFKFINAGDAPLILTNVRSSCGCTVPKWPKDPVKKGEGGIIKVKYNTRVAGRFNKSIMVYSNGSKDPFVLKIKGTVIMEGSVP